MNIDKILSKERQYNYLDRVEAALSDKGLTFLDLKNYIRCGSSIHGVPTKVLADKFGKDVELPEPKHIPAYVDIELLSSASCAPLAIKI